ncbi:MAG: sulfatase [Rhizobiaceae bacterium]|nr:sulfatase [Rhizobiaceae bacterium]MCV0404811.1 sulfatase [Rhizobiaceae bacterium]
MTRFQDGSPRQPGRGAPMRRALAILAALCVLYLALAAPNHPGAATPGAFANFPYELPLLAAFLFGVAFLPRGRRALRLAVVALLIVVLALKAADFAMFTALNRPFNLAYDLPLADAGWRLLWGSNDPTGARLLLALAAAAIIAVIAVLWWAIGVLMLTGLRLGRSSVLVVAMLCLTAAGFWVAGKGSAFSARLAGDHVRAAANAAANLATLRAEAAEDPVLASFPQPLSRLAGTDVILAFVESYGRSTLDNPLYGPTTKAALADVEAGLAARGYAMRSAWLTAPIVGGQSWLAHGTFLSGLWIDDQGRYDALLRSPRKALNRVAAEAGWRSVAVMPAIVMPWPEAGWFGYDAVHAAKDLGYRGKPFNWVTMPDQYTLSAFERLELTQGRERPVFAEIALISSHAPWTPIPRIVPWHEVGDGTVFDSQAMSGDTPEQVWADHDRVRDQFRLSIDYALRTIGDFAARHGDGKPLFIVLGDHQPAAFVSGSQTLRDVPIHMIGPPDILAAIDGWNWSEGLVPDGEAPVWRMDAFRARFIEAFSAGPEPVSSAGLDPA